MAKSPKRVRVKDAFARRNLGTVCHMGKPVLVSFYITHMPVARDVMVLIYC